MKRDCYVPKELEKRAAQQRRADRKRRIEQKFSRLSSEAAGPTAGAGDHRPGSSVPLEHPAFASGAFECVEINRLEHRLYFAVETSCTKIMRWFTLRLIRFEAVYEATEVGFRQRVTRRLLCKSVPVFQLVLKFQNLVLHRHLRRLGLHEIVDCLSGKGLDLGQVGVGLPEQFSNAFDCGRGSGNEPCGSLPEFESFLKKGHHSNRLQLVGSVGDDAVERCGNAARQHHDHMQTAPLSSAEVATQMLNNTGEQ